MAKKLTIEEAQRLESAASETAMRIFRACSQKGGDVEGCVASRVAGLQYIEDIMEHLPEDHPLKIDDEQISDITGLIKREAVSYLK